MPDNTASYNPLIRAICGRFEKDTGRHSMNRLSVLAINRLLVILKFFFFFLWNTIMFLFCWWPHIFLFWYNKKTSKSGSVFPIEEAPPMFRKGWHSGPLSGPLPVSGTFFLRTDDTWSTSLSYYLAELDEQGAGKRSRDSRYPAIQEPKLWCTAHEPGPWTQSYSKVDAGSLPHVLMSTCILGETLTGWKEVTGQELRPNAGKKH